MSQLLTSAPASAPACTSSTVTDASLSAISHVHSQLALNTNSKNGTRTVMNETKTGNAVTGIETKGKRVALQYLSVTNHSNNISNSNVNMNTDANANVNKNKKKRNARDPQKFKLKNPENIGTAGDGTVGTAGPRVVHCQPRPQLQNQYQYHNQYFTAPPNHSNTNLDPFMAMYNQKSGLLLPLSVPQNQTQTQIRNMLINQYQYLNGNGNGIQNPAINWVNPILPQLANMTAITRNNLMNMNMNMNMNTKVNATSIRGQGTSTCTGIRTATNEHANTIGTVSGARAAGTKAGAGAGSASNKQNHKQLTCKLCIRLLNRRGIKHQSGHLHQLLNNDYIMNCNHMNTTGTGTGTGTTGTGKCATTTTTLSKPTHPQMEFHTHIKNALSCPKCCQFLKTKKVQDYHLNNVDQGNHVGGGVCGYVSLQIPNSSVITRGGGGKSNNEKKKGIAVTGAGICVGTVPSLQTLKVDDKPKLKPKAKPKPKKAKELPKLVQLPNYRMPLNKYPPPGTICRRRAYYITLENDTYSSIANKLGVRSWKDICYIKENYERYAVVTAVYKDDDSTNRNGTRTRNSNGMLETETETRVVVVSSKSRFFENTLIRIPTDLCEVWRLKQLDQDRHKHGASFGMGSTDHSHVNNKGSKKRNSNSRKALEEEPNAYLEKIRAKRKRNADMLKSLGLGSPGFSSSGSGGHAKRRVIVEENGKPVSKKTKKSSVSTLQSQPRSTRLASANAIKAKEVKRRSTTSSNKRNVSKSKAKARAEKVALSNRADCKHYVGKNVAKVFCDPDDDGDCTYRGTVESVEHKNSTPFFFVIYSDGDSEGVGLSELKGE